MLDVKALCELGNINIVCGHSSLCPKERPGRDPAGYLPKAEMAAGMAGERKTMPGPLAEKRLAWQNWAIGKAGFRTTISRWPYLECVL